MARSKDTSIKSSLKLGDICTVKSAIEAMGEAASAHVGYLHGTCNGITKRSAPDGTATFTGMAGAFEMLPINGDAVRSQTCYLPASAQAPIIEPVTNGGSMGVKFAYAVSLHKGKDGADPTFKLEPIVAPVPIDPLAETRDKCKTHIGGKSRK